MRALIIDDDRQTLAVLKELLARKHPDIEVVGLGESIEQGRALIKKYQPEIIFLDIELPDGLGFDLLQKDEKPSFHVIFITAHSEYAITAIKFGALDYLLKPISVEELGASVKKVITKEKEKISGEQIQILLETIQNFNNKKLPSRIAISTARGILYRQMKDIVRLQAQQNYTEFFFWNESKTILAALNIGGYVDHFEQYPEFMKVHRAHLVNLNYVDTFSKADGGFLLMKDGAQVDVSRNYRESLLARLQEW